MMNNNRNATIDFTKYIAAIFIVGIHALPFRSINEPIPFFIVNILFRLAVPFFAVTTGYFIASKLQDCKETGFFQDAKRIILRQEIKILKLYGFCTVVYLLFSIPSWIKTGWFSLWAFADFGLAAIKTGSHYHLWYLLSLLYALPLFYFCIRYIHQKQWPVLISGLWTIKVLSYGYKLFLPDAIQHIIEKTSFINGIMDGIFCILPLLLTGFFIYKKRTGKQKYCHLLWLVSFILMSVEAFWLKAHGQTAVSYIFFTLPTAYFGFQALLSCNIQIKPEICFTLGEISVFVYCFHPIIVEGIQPLSLINIIQYALVILISTLLGLFFFRIK